MAKSSLTYASALQNPHGAVAREGGYMGFDAGGYYQISPIDVSNDDLTGWKFHLSVHPEDVGRAWDLIVDRLQKEKLHAKFVRPDVANRLGQSSHIQGKTITLYDNALPRDWEGLLHDVETTFRENDIRPGQSIEKDRAVTNSAYAYYRCDVGPDGRFVTPSDVHTYNDSGKPDPFEGIALSPQRLEANHALLRLNEAFEPFAHRYSHGDTAPRWAFAEGKGGVSDPHARLTLGSLQHAGEVQQALVDAGVNARFATKGDQVLVLVMADDFPRLTDPKVLHTYGTQQCLPLLAEQLEAATPHVVAGSHRKPWEMNPGQGGSSVPNVRLNCGESAENAAFVGSFLREDVGLPAETARKGLDYLTLVRVDSPEAGLDMIQKTTDYNLHRTHDRSRDV